MIFIQAKIRIILHTVLLFSIFSLLIFWNTIPVSALNPPLKSQQAKDVVLDSVNVEILPEYDRPAVLVIYHITLSAQTSLPADASFRIPAAAGKPFAVAWQAADKALYDLNYNSKPAGDWIELQVSSPSPDVQIEYYDPGLQKTGSQRSFTFRWPGNYAVQNFSVQVQEPVNATDMKITPDAGSGHPGALGLTYYSLLVGKVDAGTTFDLSISYNKPDDTLTNTEKFQEVQPSQPLDSSTTGRISLDPFLPWGAGALGLLLIAAGSFWYWKTGRVSARQAYPGRARHARSREVRTVAAGERSGEATFCHQCGNKAVAGDTFCRVCGTKLR